MAEINILKAPILSDYFLDFINSQTKYNMTTEFMKENIFITGVCSCGESFCSSFYLITKKPLNESTEYTQTKRNYESMYFSICEDKYLTLEYLGGEIEYFQEVLEIMYRNDALRETNNYILMET